MIAPLRCPGIACGGRMTPETRSGVTVDRCERCSGLWFDARELDRVLGAPEITEAPPPESCIPARGRGSRPCPRCSCALETAGWTDLVLDRCARCGGLFVGATEYVRLQREGLPEERQLESRVAAAVADAGWTVLDAAELAASILRFLLRH